MTIHLTKFLQYLQSAKRAFICHKNFTFWIDWRSETTRSKTFSLFDEAQSVVGHDGDEHHHEQDRHARQEELPEEDERVENCDDTMEGRPIKLLNDLLPVVVQEQDEEDNDRYDDVVEQPPLHNLHVRGGWQGFVHVGVQCVHH